MASGIKEELLTLYRSPYDFDVIYSWAKDFMDRDLTHDDIDGFVSAVQEVSTPLHPNTSLEQSIDISGTGGDVSRTINVGTLASFVLAANGMTVGKMSTRGYTGVLGSRDLLANLGIEVPRENVDPKHIEMLLEKSNLAFYFHPAFNENFTNHVRFFNELKERDLAFVTPWHLLFWVYNPLPLAYRIYGMSTDKYLVEVAQAFRLQGIKKGWVVHGVGGLDEISIIGPTKVAEFSASGIQEFETTPADFGVETSTMEAIRVKDAEEAISKARGVLSGEEVGPLMDLVAVNAAAGLCLAGLADSFKSGTQKALATLRSGKAHKKYEEHVALVRSAES